MATRVVEVPFEIVPMLGTRIGKKARTCYSCRTSYSDFFRFCPKDGVDLEYAPPHLDDLGRDLGRKAGGRKWLWIGILSVFVPLLVLSALYLGQILPASTAAQSGELVVRTTPPGAIVYLDGSQVGVTPVRLADVPTGYHDIRAVCPGYKNKNARVEILPSSSQRLVLEMTPTKTPKKDLYIAAITPLQIATGVL